MLELLGSKKNPRVKRWQNSSKLANDKAAKTKALFDNSVHKAARANLARADVRLVSRMVAGPVYNFDHHRIYLQPEHLEDPAFAKSRGYEDPDVVMTHEMAHAWDASMARAKGLRGSYWLQTQHPRMMRALRGQLPLYMQQHPRLRHAFEHRVEFPAVVTELARHDPESYWQLVGVMQAHGHDLHDTMKDFWGADLALPVPIRKPAQATLAELEHSHLDGRFDGSRGYASDESSLGPLHLVGVGGYVTDPAFRPIVVESLAIKNPSGMMWGPLQLNIEQWPGDTRKGTDPDGTPWSIVFQTPYGEVASTTAIDGDPLDVFVGPLPYEDTKTVYIVLQKNPHRGGFDEEKAMLGYGSEGGARDDYMRHYNDKRWFGAIVPVPRDIFVRIVESGIKKGTVWGQFARGGLTAERGYADGKFAEHPDKYYQLNHRYHLRDMGLEEHLAQGRKNLEAMGHDFAARHAANMRNMLRNWQTHLPAHTLDRVPSMWEQNAYQPTPAAVEALQQYQRSNPGAMEDMLRQGAERTATQLERWQQLMAAHPEIAASPDGVRMVSSLALRTHTDWRGAGAYDPGSHAVSVNLRYLVPRSSLGAYHNDVAGQEIIAHELVHAHHQILDAVRTGHKRKDAKVVTVYSATGHVQHLNMDTINEELGRSADSLLPPLGKPSSLDKLDSLGKSNRTIAHRLHAAGEAAPVLTERMLSHPASINDVTRTALHDFLGADLTGERSYADKDGLELRSVIEHRQEGQRQSHRWIRVNSDQQMGNFRPDHQQAHNTPFGRSPEWVGHDGYPHVLETREEGYKRLRRAGFDERQIRAQINAMLTNPTHLDEQATALGIPYPNPQPGAAQAAEAGLHTMAVMAGRLDKAYLPYLTALRFSNTPSRGARPGVPWAAFSPEYNDIAIHPIYTIGIPGHEVLVPSAQAVMNHELTHAFHLYKTAQEMGQPYRSDNSSFLQRHPMLYRTNTPEFDALETWARGNMGKWTQNSYVDNPDFYRIGYALEFQHEWPTVMTEFALYNPERLYALREATGIDAVDAVNKFWGVGIVGKPLEHEIPRLTRQIRGSGRGYAIPDEDSSLEPLTTLPYLVEAGMRSKLAEYGLDVYVVPLFVDVNARDFQLGRIWAEGWYNRNRG